MFLKEEDRVMDAALASLLAPFSSATNKTFDQALTNRSERVLSETPSSGLSARDADGPVFTEPNGDRVTILSRNSPKADTSGLSDWFEGLRDTAPTTSGSDLLTSGSFAFSSSFSFQASFSQLSVGSGGNANGVQGLLDNLDTLYQDLLAFSPDQAERLSILAQIIATLNPNGAEGILETIYDTMRRFSGIMGGAPAVAAPPPPPSGAPAPESAQGAEMRVEMVHFELDFEMEMTSEVTVAIAELRDQGINVQAMHIRTSQTVKIHIEFTGIRQEVAQSDPLVFDLGDDGVNLTGASEGTRFDINADGQTDTTGFVQGNDAFLALDRNSNGLIDDGAELFGDQHGARNGFEELAKYDDNADGRIDARDAVFDSLRLLHDLDGNGTVGRAETSTLAELGIASIDLGYSADSVQNDGRGNALAERSAFTRADGSKGSIVDAWVGYRA
jgi:hypothetical protein